MKKKTEQPVGPQITTGHVPIPCWKTKAIDTHTHTSTHTHTHRIYNTGCSPLQQCLRERSSVLMYTYIACHVYYYIWPTCCNLLCVLLLLLLLWILSQYFFYVVGPVAQSV